jgi:PAS domain S-box-containing protein
MNISHPFAKMTSFKKFLGFKARILIPAALVLAILFSGFLYGIWCLQDYHLQQDFASRLRSSRQILTNNANADGMILAAALDGLCRDEKLQSLWRERDRDALVEYCRPLFDSLREKFNITHFYLHEPDRVCFLRVHQPERHGDIIRRETLRQAKETGSMKAGLELGPLGTFTLRVVQPLVIDGRVEGYIELGEEVTHITKEIAGILRLNVAVLIEKTWLDREGWISGMAMHDRATNWDDLPKEVVIDSYSTGVTPKVLLKLHILQDDAVERSEEIKVNGIRFMAGCVPLYDFGNHRVGRMVIFEDIGPQRASLRMLLFDLGRFFCLITAACLIGGFFYLTHIEKLLNKSHQQTLDAHEEREAAQDRHLEEMLRFRKAIECATDAIALVSLDRQLEFVNPAFVNIFGYTMEEANAQGGTASLYTDKQLSTKLYLKVSQGRNFSGEVQMQTKDGRVVHAFLRASPILNNEGKMIGIIAIYTDLSERKSIERELLRQSEALVESNRALLEAKGSPTAEKEHA